MAPSVLAMSMVTPPPSWIRLLTRDAVVGTKECLLSAQLRETSLSLSEYVIDPIILIIYLSFHLFRRTLAAFMRYGYDHWFWKCLLLKSVHAIQWLRDFAILLFGGRLSHSVFLIYCDVSWWDKDEIIKAQNRMLNESQISATTTIYEMNLNETYWFIVLQDREWVWSCATFDSSKYILSDCGTVSTFSWSYLSVLRWLTLTFDGFDTYCCASFSLVGSTR